MFRRGWYQTTPPSRKSALKLPLYNGRTPPKRSKVIQWLKSFQASLKNILGGAMNVAINGHSVQLKNYYENVLVDHPLLTLNTKGQPVLKFTKLPTLDQLLEVDPDKWIELTTDVYEKAVKNSYDMGTFSVKQIKYMWDYFDVIYGMLKDLEDFYEKHKQFNKADNVDKVLHEVSGIENGLSSLDDLLCSCDRGNYKHFDEDYCIPCLENIEAEEREEEYRDFLYRAQRGI